MSESLGAIFYSVDANTAALIEASQKADLELKKWELSCIENIKAAERLNPALKQVGAITVELGKAYFALGKQVDKTVDPSEMFQNITLEYVLLNAAKELIKIVGIYRGMSLRIKMITGNEETFNYVQNRLFQSANIAYYPLDEMQGRFISISDDLRGLGYSLEQSMDIIDSLNYALICGTTDINKRQAALSIYDIALKNGELDMMGFQSLLNAVPILIQNIGDTVGDVADEIREPEVNSKYPIDLLNNVLLETFDRNKSVAEAIYPSVENIFIKLQNNFSQFVAEENIADDAIDVVASTLGFLADNLKELSVALFAIGADILAKNTSALATEIEKNDKAAFSTIAHIRAELVNALENEQDARAVMLSVQQNLGKRGTNAAKKIAEITQTKAAANVFTAQSITRSMALRFIKHLGGPAGLIGVVTAVTTGLMRDDDSEEVAMVEGKKDLKNSINSEVISEKRGVLDNEDLEDTDNSIWGNTDPLLGDRR